MSEQYLPVPVDAAREIARRFMKEIVVVVALDREFARVNVTTFGSTAGDKVRAAALGAMLGRAAGLPDQPLSTSEDFRRDLTAATWAAQRDELIEALKLAATGLVSGDVEPGGEVERITAATEATLAKFTKGGAQ